MMVVKGDGGETMTQAQAYAHSPVGLVEAQSCIPKGNDSSGGVFCDVVVWGLALVKNKVKGCIDGKLTK